VTSTANAASPFRRLADMSAMREELPSVERVDRLLAGGATALAGLRAHATMLVVSGVTSAHASPQRPQAIGQTSIVRAITSSSVQVSLIASRMSGCVWIVAKALPKSVPRIGKMPPAERRKAGVAKRHPPCPPTTAAPHTAFRTPRMFEGKGRERKTGDARADDKHRGRRSFAFLSSRPRLSRASRSSRPCGQTWMAGTSPP
jgi:hypothetical protein